MSSVPNTEKKIGIPLIDSAKIIRNSRYGYLDDAHSFVVDCSTLCHKSNEFSVRCKNIRIPQQRGI